MKQYCFWFLLSFHSILFTMAENALIEKMNKYSNKPLTISSAYKIIDLDKAQYPPLPDNIFIIRAQSGITYNLIGRIHLEDQLKGCKKLIAGANALIINESVKDLPCGSFIKNYFLSLNNLNH